MKILPFLPLEAMPGRSRYHKHKKTQTTEPGASEATQSETTHEITQPKSSLPIGIKPEVISLETGESKAVETSQPKMVEIIELEFIEPKVVDSKILQPKVIQPEEPRVTELVTSRNYSSISMPLSHPQPLYLGVEAKPFPLGLLNIEDITEEDPSQSQTPILLIRTPPYQVFPIITHDT